MKLNKVQIYRLKKPNTEKGTVYGWLNDPKDPEKLNLNFSVRSGVVGYNKFVDFVKNVKAGDIVNFNGYLNNEAMLSMKAESTEQALDMIKEVIYIVTDFSIEK